MRVGEGELFGDAFQRGQLAERLVQLGARLELAGVERALAREAGGVEHGDELPRPLGGGTGLALGRAEGAFQMFPEKRNALRLGDCSLHLIVSQDPIGPGGLCCFHVSLSVKNPDQSYRRPPTDEEVYQAMSMLRRGFVPSNVGFEEENFSELPVRHFWEKA